MKSTQTAFPIQGFKDGEGCLQGQLEHGITVRDYIAIKAMQGILFIHSNGEAVESINNICLIRNISVAQFTSEKAYEMADAMIAESEK